MTTLHIDFETYSAADLPACGLDNYASHPSTGVHCMAYCFDDGPVGLFAGAYLPTGVREVWDHVRNGGTVVAHNAAFELAIWNKVCVPKYGWPILSPKQMRCTMAQAYAMSLPGSLDKASNALGIDQKKDLAGARVMMQLAKPKLDGTFWKPEDDPAKFDKLYAYCKQDVEVERELDNRMMQLSDEEQQLWVLDYIINQRGVQVDLPSINAAITLVEAEKARLDKEMLRVTGGVVGKCTEVQLLIKWIRNEGVTINGLAKSDVLDSLSGDLPERVRLALNLRKEAAKSSTAKLIAMKSRASRDGRVRGTLQYHGASTGRWAGRGIQVQNFPRPRVGTKPKHIEDIIAHLKDRDYIDMCYGPVLDAMADSLRAMIAAKPDHDLIAVDFSNVESRVLAWLAGAEWKLQVFRDYDAGVGPDIYLVAVSWVYGGDPKALKPHRQEGKAIELGYGFGGGAGAAFTMAKTYGVNLLTMYDTVCRIATAEMMERSEKMWLSFKRNYTADQHKPFIAGDILKQFYRAKNPEIVAYWHDLESAAVNAVELGVVCKAGPAGRQISFVKNGSFLWCKLPSNRVLCYPYPTIKEKETPWGAMSKSLHFMSVNGTTNKWEDTSTYGGSLAENVTQALSRDLLAPALHRLEDNGFPVVFHAHDEAVVEIASTMPKETLGHIEQLAAKQPSWATGLPLAAEGWRAKRYRK